MSNLVLPLSNTVLMPNAKFILVLCGLPARGKSYISYRVSRYLNWIGVKTQTFSVSNYRRQTTPLKDHEFFHPENKEGARIRLEASIQACEDLKKWLENENGQVGIFDAINETKEKRAWLLQQFQGFHVILIESICTDTKVIETNILEVKSSSPDYIDMNEEQAIADFMQRIQHYESTYETIDENEDKAVPFIKMINQGEKYIMNRISGSIPTRIMYFLMNIRMGRRTIYLSRHGESYLNVEKRIGGNPGLTPRGLKYKKALAEFMEKQNIPDLTVWTSEYRRTIETAALVKSAHVEQWGVLNELQAGICEGMSYKEIAAQYPDEYAERDKDKYNYRYPKGESYQDLVARLEPIIMALERQNNVLLICHQAVVRCLLAYLFEKDKEELPYLDFPFDTVYKITTTAKQCIAETFTLQDLPFQDDTIIEPQGGANA